MLWERRHHQRNGARRILSFTKLGGKTKLETFKRTSNLEGTTRWLTLCINELYTASLRALILRGSGSCKELVTIFTGNHKLLKRVEGVVSEVGLWSATSKLPATNGRLGLILNLRHRPASSTATTTILLRITSSLLLLGITPPLLLLLLRSITSLLLILLRSRSTSSPAVTTISRSSLHLLVIASIWSVGLLWLVGDFRGKTTTKFHLRRSLVLLHFARKVSSVITLVFVFVKFVCLFVPERKKDSRKGFCGGGGKEKKLKKNKKKKKEKKITVFINYIF
jgi:hypothetical protein